MAPLPARARSAAAIGLLLLVIAALSAVSILPLWQRHQAYDQRIVELQHQIERFTQHVAQLPQLEQQRTALLELYGDGFYLNSQTEALAAADLQRITRKAVAKAGGELHSTQVLAAVDEEGFQRIAVRVHMRGGVVTLRDALHTLETGKPYLFIGDLKIRALNGVPGRHMRAAQDLLDIRFELFGYRAQPSQAHGGGNV
jgi:general secretion pathway protein M